MADSPPLQTFLQCRIDSGNLADTLGLGAGIFNGALTWMATIVLILFLLGGSVVSLLRVVTNTAAGSAAVPAVPAGAVAGAVLGADTAAEAATRSQQMPARSLERVAHARPERCRIVDWWRAGFKRRSQAL